MPRLVTPATSLAVVNPALAAQWHPTLNKRTPHDITATSGQQAWFTCENGHTKLAYIFSRNNGKRCGDCSGRYATPENNLAVRSPDVAKEWHPTKNGKKTPFQVLPGSLAFAWWVCPESHSYRARIGSRTAKTRPSGCPECANRKVTYRNSLASRNPKVARMWHPTLNGDVTPKDVVPTSNPVFWWQCDKGHAPFERAVLRMTQHTGSCPFCIRRRVSPETSLASTHPALCEEWDYEANGDLKPTDVLSGTDRTVAWKCSARSHRWTAKINNRVNGTGCPACPKSVSGPEARLHELVSLVADVSSDSRVQGATKSWSCDIVIRPKKVVIEYDGWYWHKSPAKHKTDTFKTKDLAAAGWRVIRVRETPLKAITENDVCIPQYGADEAFDMLCKTLRLPKSKAKHKITKIPKASRKR